MSSILGTYARRNISFKEGKGCYLFSDNGEKYLDFVQGIAVNVLGHCNEHLVKTIKEQSSRLWHVSNVFVIPEQEKLASKNKAISREYYIKNDRTLRNKIKNMKI